MKILLWLCLEKQYHTCAYCDNMIFSCSQNELATHHYIVMLPTNGLPLNYLFLQDSTWNLFANIVNFITSPFLSCPFTISFNLKHKILERHEINKNEQELDYLWQGKSLDEWNGTNFVHVRSWFLHIISTQGKSNQARVITMVKLRLGHLTITMLHFYVNPYKWKATCLLTSFKIWKLHTMIHSIKIFIT